MNKITYIIIFLCLTNLSCKKQNTFEEANNWYMSNNQEVLEVIEILHSNKNLYSLRRNENTNDKVWLTYTLRLNSVPKSYTLLIDSNFKDNESSFWKKKFSSILTTSNQSLQSILDSSSISDLDFLKITSFLSKNNISIITRLIDFNFILIMYDPTYGFLYNPESESPKYPEAQEIKKIDDHIYYFKQKP